MCNVAGPLLAEQLAALDSAMAINRGVFSVTFTDETTFIRDQGTFIIETLQTIPSESAVAITRSVAMLFDGLYTGIMDAVATRDSNNQSFTEALPPVLHRFALVSCVKFFNPVAFDLERLVGRQPRSIRLKKTTSNFDERRTMKPTSRIC